MLSDPTYLPSKWERLIEGCLAPHGIVPGSSEQAVVFTEFADSAEWIVRRLADDGFTARMYSGRQSHNERDEVRAAFMRGEFQVIVTTDAGNEGIDLQAARVLVNYDIPWSLVRLEQRMGRIHRVGQRRDVFLYNLVATDTREGEALLALLDRFVTAANELGGQMFDSLSTVAEMTGLMYEKWLSDLYGNNEVKKQEALAAVRKVQAVDLERAARDVRTQESRFASQVDAMAALTLLQEDLLERINPAIVESYLSKLADAGLFTAQATAAGAGIVQLSADEPLPDALGGTTSALVATSGEALRTHAGHVNVSNVVRLGPGEPAFTELIDFADHRLGPDVYRSGGADDPASMTGYDLYAFESTLSEAGGARTTRWAALIRLDDNGNAYPVRWETLANLVPSGSPGRAPHPARDAVAARVASEIAQSTRAAQQRVRGDWFRRASFDLKKLPIDLTQGLPDREQRVKLRKQLEQRTAERLERLRELNTVELPEPRQVARLRVHPTAEPITVEEKNSEDIAMKLVYRMLAGEGWSVADVHTENRGYDLHAVRGHEQRLIEVKGVWLSASSEGIRMTGNEVLMATQHRTDFWLYVVDNCQDGAGVLFGAYRDPATVFARDMTEDAVFRVPGSSLAKHRTLDGQEPTA